jgi:glucose-1-phosphate thymidylyltransferase
MKLIIPMAGRGTRVRPHSHTVPKPLLPVAGTMIIERIIETFARTLDREITDIVYILGPDFGKDIRNELSALSDRHNANAFFKVQDVALGTAHAIACAEEHLDGEVIVVFADTLFDTPNKVVIDDADSVIWLKEVEDPSRFGVAVHEGDTITGFVEKPKEFISNLAIIGVYYFKDGAELMHRLQYLLDNDIKGPGGEFFLTDALDNMLKDGMVFKTATVDEWLDCGTLPAWRETTGVILEKERHAFNADAYPDSNIIEPVFIGEGVHIEGSTIGPNVSLEKGAVVKNSTITESIIRSDAHIEDSRLNKSTIGSHTKVHNAEGNIHIGDHSVLEMN